MMRTKIWCIVSDVEGIQPLQIDKFFCTLAVDQVEGIAEILLFIITRQRNIIVAHYNLKKIIQILSTWNQLRQLFKEMCFK